MLSKNAARKLLGITLLIFVFAAFAGLFFSIHSSALNFSDITGDENAVVATSESEGFYYPDKSGEDIKTPRGDVEHLKINKLSFIQSDSNTSFFLRFDNNLTGEQGETSLSSSGFNFQTGIQNQSVFLGNPNQLTYSSQDNINALEGTIEFWIKPNWNGNDSQQHQIFQWNDGAGVHISRDSANNLKIIANRFGTNPGGETFFNTSTWLANQWHYVAFTYSSTQGQVKVYIDGQLKNTNTFNGMLPQTQSATMQLGGLGQDRFINAGLDDFIISNVARSEQEISQRYLSYDLSNIFSSLILNPSPVIGGQTTTGTITFNIPTINARTVSLSSSDTAFLSVQPVVTIPANARSATFPVSTNAVSNPVSVTVTATSADKSINTQINVVPPCQTPLPPQIISLWSGNDNGLDSVGSANQDWSSFADGKIGRAFSFASNNRFFTGFAGSVQLFPNFTFEAWVRPTNLNGIVLTDRDTFGINRQSKIVSLSNGTFQVGTNNSNRVSTNFSADIGQWQHIAFVVTPTTIYFYKNGVQFSTLNSYASNLRNISDGLYIGDSSNFSGFVGQIDEPTIYSRALAQSEVQAIYSAGDLGKCYSSELQSLILSQSAVNVNSTATGTISLATAAPTGGAQISLVNSDETLASIPATVTIPEGELQTTFTVTTLSSTRNKTLNINAVYQSSVRSALLTVASPSDLQVITINAPTEASTGTPFTVTPQIINSGPGDAEGNAPTLAGTFILSKWTDAVYFSLDNQVGNDIVIKNATDSPVNTLNPNQTYTQIFDVTIPPSAVTQDGDYFIYVRTNLIPGPFGYVRNESNTENNVTFRPIHVLYKAADLQVSGVNTPTEADTGASFNISWSDTNAGTLATGGYSDEVYFSTDNQVGNDVSLKSISQLTLEPNQPRVSATTVTIPTTAVSQDGDYFVYIKTDSSNIVSESNENNNIAFHPVRVNYRVPDLQVGELNPPTEVETGTRFNITWNDLNTGTQQAGTYFDDVYFSTDNQIGGDVYLGGVQQSSLLPNQSVAKTIFATIARTVVTQDGDYFIYVKTDSRNEVLESNENNNITFRPIRVLYRVPDLQVNNINVPTEIGSGSQFNLSWNDINSGTGRANSWSDQVFFSRDNQVGSDTFLGTVTQLTSLEPNQSVIKNLNVTIPRTVVTQDGDYYIYVKTDSGNSVDESNENNNITFRPIRVYITFPDLQAVNLSTPLLVNLDIPFEFSWSDKNAGNRAAIGPWRDKLYISTNPQIDANDFVVGEFEFTESINPNESLVRTRTLTIPSNQSISDGTLYLIVQTDSTNAVFEDTKENNNTAFVALAPDLQITASTAPTQTDTDSNFNVSWTDRNLGNRTANPIWSDRILLSTDNLPSGNDTVLGNFPFANPLTPNSAADRIQTISIPRNSITQNGNYFLIVQTDANNNINEVGNENNNFVAKPISVRKTPLPDLTIQSITAPDTAFFGQTIRVQWTVKNIGDGPTNAAEWHDWYYISSDNVPEIEDPFKAPLQNVSYLAAGESYTASAEITIPQGLVGNYKILVWTDSDGTNHRTYPFNVIELDDSNNYNLARPIRINAPPLPDLQTTLVQAQEEAFAGQPFNLNWRVENRGDGTTPPTVQSWNDKIYLSQNTTFEPNLDRLIGSRPHDGRLFTAEDYSVNSFSVTLPNDIAGNWYVFVVADGDNQIFEFGNENNNSNYDREQPGSPMLIRATPPDLIIPNVINSPNNGQAAGQITVGWTVRNQGAFDAAPNWFDTIYLSSDAILDTATDTPLGTIARSNPLGAGLTYDATANVTLPSCIGGNYYLFVFADSRKQIFEYDPTFEAEANNFSQAKPITITSSPSDLRVTAIENPVSGVAGQPTLFSWTVANQGTGATLNTVWNDEVYLSPTAVFVKANSARIGAFTHTGALAIGDSYSQTQNIVIPNTAQGNYYVFVLTDANDNVEECGAANNDNSSGSSTIFNVSNSLPDLTVSSFAFANSFIAGQNVNVTWTVNNGGTAAAQNSSWGDSVYFSTNNALDANDRKLTDVVVEGGLAPNAAYTKNAQVLLPIVAPGSYFLIVKTDNGDNVFEGQGENNNTRTLVLPIDVPPVDLQVTAVNAPATVFSGQSMTVDWTIQNTGNSQTVGANWTDAVVLSLDQIDDPTDRVIGYLQHEGALGGGANYTAATDVAVPSGLAGQYYIFIRADRNNQLAESNENNNSSSPKPVSLQLAPPSDLIVTSVTQPATASPGESATFNWAVQNIGANPATGLWTDTVYLSSDQTWDIGDVLVGRYTAGVNVAPGQTYNGTLSTALPAVNLGNYYVIVRTDIRNRVIETNETNNSGVSSGTTTVDVPELQLGVPQSTTLITGQERFYKFNAPANETVRVSLDGQDGSSNELYTRFGQMASRNDYDFFFDRLYEADQQLVIPNTTAGNYYNMIRGENVPNSLVNNEVKPAGKLNTKPIDLKQTTTAENVTVKAEIIPFSITSVSANRIGDNGQVTITLKGARFENGALVKLVQGTTVLSPAKIIFVDAATVKARFLFANAQHGIYDVVLTNTNNQSAYATQAVTIETATSLSSVVDIFANNRPRVGRKVASSFIVKNISNVDIPYCSVGIAIEGDVVLSLQQPNSTLPNRSINSLSADLTYSGFVKRDFEVGEKLSFNLTFSGFRAGQFRVHHIVKSRNKTTFINDTRRLAEVFRLAYLNDTNKIPNSWAVAINDSENFWNAVKNDLIEEGFLDEIDINFVELQNLKAFGYKSSLLSEETCIQKCVRKNTKKALGNSTKQDGASLLLHDLLCIELASGPLADVPGDSPECDSVQPPCGIFATLKDQITGGGDCWNGQIPSDPNDKQCPTGFGVEKFVSSQSPMLYTVNFENVPTATASAQRVRVTDQLDPNVDPRTFRLKEIGFGSYRLQVPENRAFFQQRVQLGAEFNNLLADISTGVDISTGKVTWTLTAIDPATGEQPNSANLGLLAPNDETGRGQGFVTYTVQPKQTAPTGTVIRNNATIIFDTEEPITTNTVTNTLDADIPTSAVNALPAYQSNPAFTVSWAGTDAANGSGLQNYDIWVAEGDGAYQPFVSGTTETSATFTGTMGKVYRFYSVARDNAGNVEAAPAAPDTITRLFAPTAANVTLDGRIMTRSGRGISRARVRLTNENGQTLTTRSNAFGYYKFANVAAGQTYIISVEAKGYTFADDSQVRSVTEDTADINFTAN